MFSIVVSGSADWVEVVVGVVVAIGVLGIDSWLFLLTKNAPRTMIINTARTAQIALPIKTIISQLCYIKYRWILLKFMMSLLLVVDQLG